MRFLDPRRIKISIVSFTNTLPFKWALNNSPLQKGIELEEDMPSDCARKLKSGLVDLALVPVALIPELKEHHIVGDYCIGAAGKVDSVKLYSEVPLKEIRSVILDYQSKSSITLTRVLSRFYWNHEPRFIPGQPGFENEIKGTQAAVVIGDRTFALNGNFLFEYDLAQEWMNFTGLPFVFAAWISTRQLPSNFIAQFNDTLSLGVKNIPLAISAAGAHTALSNAELKDYLMNRIDYYFDEEKRQALQLFLKYMRQL